MRVHIVNWHQSKFLQGVDYTANTCQNVLRDGGFYKDMTAIWFSMGDKEYDNLCKPFSNVIREAAQTSFPEWENTVDSKMAKMILFDQLSRNCFRGTDEAYKYDHLSQPLARELTQYALEDDKTTFSFTGGEYTRVYQLLSITIYH